MSGTAAAAYRASIGDPWHTEVSRCAARNAAAQLPEQVLANIILNAAQAGATPFMWVAAERTGKRHQYRYW